MTQRQLVFGLLVGLAFVAAARSNGGNDRLPAGAVARIGSPSFRHGGSIVALAFAPNGKTIYAASPLEKQARAWEIATGQELRQFDAQAGVQAVVALPDGKRIVTADSRLAIRLWDTTSGKELRRIREPEDAVGQAVRLEEEIDAASSHPLALAADGTTLASLYRNDGTIHVWDVATGAERAAIEGKGPGGFYALDLSADGKTVLAGTRRGPVAIYAVATGQTTQTYNGFTEAVQCVALSSDGKFVAGMAGSQGLRVWDAPTGKQLFHDGKPVGPAALAFAPDGRTLAIAYRDGEAKPKLRVVDSATGEQKCAVEGLLEKIATVAFSPDGKTLAAAGSANTVRFFDAATGTEQSTRSGHGGAMTTIGLSPDGKLLLTCSVNDSTVLLWDAQTGRIVRRLEGNDAGVDEVQYSPDGKYVASATKTGRAIVWEAATGKVVCKLEGHPSLGPHIRFSPDGRRIVVGGDNRVVAVWDVESGKVLHEYPTPPGGIASIATFDDDAIWAVEAVEPDGDADGQTVSLFDLVGGKVVRRFRGNALGVSGVGVAPDRRSMATNGKDGTIRVYEVATGAERQRFTEEGEQSSWTGTQFVALAPDGRTLVTCGTATPVAKLWDLATGQLLKTLTGHRGVVGAVDISLDGRRLVTGSQDTTCIVWDMPALRGAARIAPTSDELAAHWQALNERDALKAYRGLQGLIGGGATAVAFARERLSRKNSLDGAQLARWIRELDAPQYGVRERATAALAGHLDQAEPALRAALATTTSAEVRQRVRTILDGPRLREVRIVEFLEALGSPEAATLLDELARGPDGSLMTRESRAAVKRLAMRNVRL